MKKLAVVALLLATFFPSLAQTGTIRGTVFDQSLGEPLIGVTVLVVGTSTGAVTDFDGKFEIKIASGTYNLQVSFVSFETINISGLEVKPGEVTVLSEIWMTESVQTLASVMVTAEAIRSSEEGLLTVKRKSAALIDGISAASFKKIGDSDAADAVKRVTGVSVEGGKYVYVRGLGDRYTKTMLNNMDIPGLDPDRNSLQMDIFPTNLISNMTVMKSFTADMPADFTGGLVNIETKDFPDERVFDISVGLGFNPSMHFNDDYLSYEGSKTDWLGFDDGQRELPSAADGDASSVPSPLSSDYTDQEVNDFLKTWNPVLGAQKNTSLMDYSFSTTYANQNAVGGNKLGYIFSVSYKNNTRFFDDRSYGEYQLDGDRAVSDLVQGTVRDGALGEREVLVGGLAGVAYKTQRTKVRFTAMHLQNGVSTAGQFVINNNDGAAGSSGYTGFSDNLEYNQRGLTNLFLGGEVNNADGSWNIDWSISSTFSDLVDPDIRKTAFTNLGEGTTFSSGNAGFPFRSWRYLDEVNLVGKVDATRKYELFGSDAKFKFGARHVYKDRNYRILTYYNKFWNNVQPDWNSDPNAVWNEDNLYPNGSVWIESDVSNPNPNEYSSHVHNSGFYVSNEFTPVPLLKAIVGLRGEQYQQWHTGRDLAWAQGNTDGNNLDNAKVLNSFDLFPSVNLIYTVTEEQNIRASYSRTIARPSFKELSYAQIIDPISGRVFNGGLYSYSSNGEITWDGNLTETRIDNYDVRWEYYMKSGQMFSVSVFYKSFQDPIELIRIYEGSTATEFQPRNVGNGTVVGTEIEIRKSLDFISPSLKMFSLNGNYTFVRSAIDMTEREFIERENNARDGQSIKNTRSMAGQAPYIINAGLQYDNPRINLDAGLFYNVKGSTLLVVGGNIYPDVYVQPFHSLNFNFNKSFGPEAKSTINFSVSNILDSVRAEDFEGYKASNQTFTRFKPGTSYSVGYKFSF